MVDLPGLPETLGVNVYRLRYLYTIVGGKVVEMDILADPDRITRLDLPAVEP